MTSSDVFHLAIVIVFILNELRFNLIIKMIKELQ